MSPMRQPLSRGFTAIELMIVGVMLAVITTIAAPGLRTFVISQRVKALSHDLATDLMLARSEGLKRSATAQLIAAPGGLVNGWTVAAGNTVLGWRASVPAGVTVVNAPATIAFNSNGRVSAPNAQVRITVRPSEDASEANQRCVELDLSGRVRSQSGACT